jgi:hypothetical protein
VVITLSLINTIFWRIWWKPVINMEYVLRSIPPHIPYLPAKPNLDVIEAFL